MIKKNTQILLSNILLILLRNRSNFEKVIILTLTYNVKVSTTRQYQVLKSQLLLHDTESDCYDSNF